MAKLTIEKHIAGLKFLEAELIVGEQYALSDHIRAFWRTLEVIREKASDSVVDKILEEIELP